MLLRPRTGYRGSNLVCNKGMKAPIQFFGILWTKKQTGNSATSTETRNKEEKTRQIERIEPVLIGL